MNLFETASISALSAILTTIFISPISTYITTLFALRRYQAEKWWERRLAAYEDILVKLHDIILYYDEQIEYYFRRMDMPDDMRQELGTKSYKSRIDLRKSARIGSFILSVRSEAILNQCDKDLQNAIDIDDWFQSVDTCLAISLEAFKQIRDEARKDLRLGQNIPGASWVETHLAKVRNRSGHIDLGAPNAN